MRVVGSGFGRTGTLSTKRALEILGFGPCYHMEEVIRRPSHVRAWLDVADGRPVDWHDLFAGFDSSVDFPASVVWEDLVAAFPDAKVLHTVRDPARWYDSTAETIARSPTLVPRWVRTAVPPIDRFFRVSEVLIWGQLFEGRFHDRERAIEIYEEWTDLVRERVPADRLLVFDVADGWEPLCRFLAVPIPEQPFPRVNDRRTMLRRFAAIRAISRGLPVVGALLAGRRLLAILRRSG